MEPRDDPRYYESACLGKEKFPSEGAAEGFLREARRPVRRNIAPILHDVDWLSAYECPFCGSWHVGRYHHGKGVIN